MVEFQLNTPVALIIFNRPDTTERVFAEIAKAKPPILLVVADGPRENRPEEAQRCARARDCRASGLALPGTDQLRRRQYGLQNTGCKWNRLDF